MRRLSKSLYLYIILLTSLGLSAQNLLTNGDFESGGNGVGFSINSCCYNAVVPSGTTIPGNYAVTNNPFPMNTANFIAGTDHSGSGNMLVVDGTNTGGQQRFWRAGNTGGGACGLTVGVTYTFSFWIKSVSTTTTNLGTQAQIGIAWNNASNITLTSVNTVLPNGYVVAPLPAIGWQHVVYTFRPTNACVNIEIFDDNTSIGGNDFAVDDFSLIAPIPPLSLTYSITNLTCINANDGTIFGYGIGGTQPYVNYTLSGAIAPTNSPTGFFTGLAPGTYNLSVTDNAGTSISQTGIIIPAPTGLTLTAANASICAGASTTLTATGGGTYVWSVDNAEAVPSGANPSVSPGVTTTYTVNSTTVTPDNLVYNGDFFLGNVGFTSDYNYYNPNNPTNVQKAYGVVTDAETWEVGFSPCNDHTSTTGKMMVVDGSTSNSGNDKVWCQTVPVTPGQSYAIKYWVQTLATPNQANIDVTINSVSLGTALAPAATCTWTQQSYNWTAGAGVTTAQICIYNRSIALAGNDFALDDIVFSRSNTCVLPPKSVTVTVIPRPVITASVTTQTSCIVPTGTITVSAPIGANFEYSINGTTYQPSPIFTGLAANNYSVIVRNIATTCVSIPVVLTINATTGAPNVSGTTGVAPNCGVKLIGNSTDLGVTIVWNGPGLPLNSPNPSTATSSATYTVTVTNTVSGCSNAANVVVVLPTAPSAPTLTVTQPGCVVATGTILVTTPSGSNLEYSIDSITYQTNPSFSGLAASNYNVTVRNTTTGCVSPITNIALIASTPATIPTATSPIYYCQGSTAVPLTATASTGGTLSWYGTDATGGTASATAPTPSTAANGTYYVSQTVGICESPRKAISVIVNNTPGVINMFCDPNQATTTTSIWFDWNNLAGPPVYHYTYSINGGPLVTGAWNISHFEVMGVLPGQSATFNITSIDGYPCVLPTTITCGNCVATTTPTFTLPSSICSGSVAPALPTTSTNGISGTWSPATVSNTTGGNYVFTPNATLFPCADQFTKAIAVASPPVAGTLSGTQSVCVGLTTTFTSTTTGGTWSSANTAIATVNASTGVITGVTSGTVSIDYTVAGTGGCASVTGSRSVTVSNPVSAGTLSGNQAICVANTTTFIPTILGGTWSSSSNAIATVNATGVITGVSAGAATITYTVSGTGGCPNATVTRTVTVSAIPSAGVLSGNQTICIGFPTVFTSTVTGGIWSSSDTTVATVSSTGDIIGIAAGTATINYIVNGTGGCPASTPATRTVTVSAPQNPGILSGGQSICVGGTTTFASTASGGTWTSSNTAVATIDASTGVIIGITNGTATMTYTITGTGGCNNTNATRLVTVNPNILPTFNAVAPICEGNTLAPLPLTSTNGITGTWNPALDNISTTEYTFTPTPGLCATIAKLTITVNPRIVPLFGAFAPLCQGAVAPILPTNSENTPAITGTWNPPTVSTVNLGTTIYTFNPTAGQCVSNTLTTLSFTVVPVLIPNFQPISDICDGKAAPLLSNTSPNGVEGTWSPSIISNTLSGNYLFTPNSDQCAVTQTLSVTITPRTVPDFATIPAFCKGTTAPVLPLTSPNGITGTWNPAVVDNTTSINNFPYEFTPDELTECATHYTMFITVTEPVYPGFPDLALCTGTIAPPLPAISPNGVSGTWSPATIDNTVTGIYQFTPDAGECALSQTLNVTVNEYTLIAIDGIVTNYFEENQIITVLATDPGNYLYQLDYGPLQESNVFYEVSSGTHVIKVVDANGCSSPLTRDVLVINYPKFFTPNDDGYNNTWNIAGLKEQLNARIFIFDRYGKLLKEIFPSGDGWDGTFNGQRLPADDYWFSVDYEENGAAKNFKAHFSLKR